MFPLRILRIRETCYHSWRENVGALIIRMGLWWFLIVYYTPRPYSLVEDDYFAVRAHTLSLVALNLEMAKKLASLNLIWGFPKIGDPNIVP